jgi:hypothetical protein
MLEKLRTGNEKVLRAIVMINLELRDKIVLNRGGCDALFRSHLVSWGIWVMSHAYVSFSYDLYIFFVFATFYNILFYFAWVWSRFYSNLF